VETRFRIDNIGSSAVTTFSIDYVLRLVDGSSRSYGTVSPRNTGNLNLFIEGETLHVKPGIPQTFSAFFEVPKHWKYYDLQVEVIY